MGHDGCGAVQAALERPASRDAENGAGSRRCLRDVLPGLAASTPALTWDEQLELAVEANVRWAVKSILAMPEAQQRKVEGVLKLVGAVYDLATGRVRFLEPAPEGLTLGRHRTLASGRAYFAGACTDFIASSRRATLFEDQLVGDVVLVDVARRR